MVVAAVTGWLANTQLLAGASAAFASLLTHYKARQRGLKLADDEARAASCRESCRGLQFCSNSIKCVCPWASVPRGTCASLPAAVLNLRNQLLLGAVLSAIRLRSVEVLRLAHDVLLSAGQLDVPAVSPALARQLHLESHPLLRVERALDAPDGRQPRLEP